jgi:hypothetical protein
MADGIGLSHYNNSKAATNNYEPLFLNQFEVLITPPTAITGADILVQQVKKISGLPELTPVGFVEQHYKWAKRTYAKPKPEDTTAELEIEFEVNLNDSNQMYVYNTIRQWSDVVFDPLTGKMGLKKDYIGQIDVVIHNKAQSIYRKFSFKPAYPIDPLKKMDLDYMSEEVYSLVVKFKCDAYTESREGA